jgi:hypothetical protein
VFRFRLTLSQAVKLLLNLYYFSEKMGYSEDMEYEAFVGNMPINVNSNNSTNFAIIVFIIAIGVLIFLVISGNC